MILGGVWFILGGGWFTVVVGCHESLRHRWAPSAGRYAESLRPLPSPTPTRPPTPKIAIPRCRREKRCQGLRPLPPCTLTHTHDCYPALQEEKGGWGDKGSGPKGPGSHKGRVCGGQRSLGAGKCAEKKRGCFFRVLWVGLFFFRVLGGGVFVFWLGVFSRRCAAIYREEIPGFAWLSSKNKPKKKSR